MKGSLSLRGFRKLRTGAIVATGVFLIGLANVQTTVQASEEDGVWVARTVEQVKADIQKEDNFFKYEIKWGDTLSVISEATNIPVDVLKEMNRISDRNLFLPHNELLYTEGESVTDSKTKHKIVIKESYGKKEVRTYEVVLQKNHETAEVSFELKETTEKVQATYTSVVSYDEVYNLVSEPVEDVTEAPTPAQPAETTPAGSGTTEMPAPTKPAEEHPAAPGATETPTPAQPAETTPASSGTTETPTPAQPTEENPTAPGTTEMPAPAQPAETTPAGSETTETPTPAQPVEETPAAPGVTETPTPAQPAEETPAPGATETPAPTKTAEEHPAAPGATETPAPAQPAETTPAGSGATETPAPAQPAEGTPAGSGATETPTPAQPAEEKPATSGTTETPAPAQPAETTPAGSGATETPAPAQPAEEHPAAPGTTETPAPAQPAETIPAGSGAAETPTPAQPAEEHPAASGAAETPTPAQPAEEHPAAPGTAEKPAPAQPAEEHPVAPGATETPTTAQPTEGTSAGSGATETPAPAQPAAPGATETPAPAQPAEEHLAAPGATETPAPAQPAEEHPVVPGATETPTPAQPAEEQPAGSGATETPAPTKPEEEHSAGSGATETPTTAQPTEGTSAGSGATETPAPAQPAAPGATETPAPAQPAETTEDTPADSNNQNKPTEPKDDVEKGLKENNEELESRKNIKLKEIESSSLSSSEKEAAKLKVEEYTTKAKEAMKQAKTTDDQAAVVDNYSDDLATINTPGVDQGKPDYTNSGLSGNGPEGTHIGDNNVIGHGNSTPENTSFRNAPVYQPRVTRRARSVDEPMDKVAIYYNYTEMKDIAGFLGDPGETVVTVPKGATHEQVQAIVKSKIDEKKAELAKRGYTFLEDYFVDKPQEDTIRYDYIVNFTKPSSLRMAPMIQPRASRTRRSVEEPKVKTRTITLYYQLAELEIAGSLGNPGQNYVITVPETATAEEIQQAIDQQTSREKASLSRYFQYVGETNLQNDILDRGFGNFDYVITFARRK